MNEAADTFASPAPAGSGDRDMTYSVSGSGAGPNFDDFDSMDKAKKDYSKVQKETNDVPKKDPVKKEAKETAPKEVKEKVPEKTDSKGESNMESVPEVLDAGKSIKGKWGEKEWEVGANYKIPHKVDGEDVEVTVQELLDNYSGKQSWDKKFTSLDKERQQYNGERDDLVGHLQKFKGELDKVYSEGFEGDPSDGFNYLLDLIGVDSDNFRKKIRDYNQKDFEAVMDMDESERSNYYLQKENSYLRSRQESSKARFAEEQSSREFEGKVEQLRETHNVSEESFSNAHNEMEKLGYENINPEQVIQYTKVLPHLTRAEGLLNQVSPEAMSDPDVSNRIISSIAEITVQYPDTTDEEIIKSLRDELGVNAKVKSINDKIKDAARVSPKADLSASNGTIPKSSHVESWADFDEY